MSRCVILIDGGYLDKILQNEFSDSRIDIGLLGDQLAGNQERLRTYYYHCMPFQGNPPTAQEKQLYRNKSRFIHKLKQLPRFQFRQGKLQKIGNTYKQKRVDILIAVDLVRLSTQHQVERAVLITGDSDLVPAVEVAKDSGVLVQLYYSVNACHNELLQACDETLRIDQDLIDGIKLSP